MGKTNSKLSPETLSELQKSTHFDKREIQSWYGAFVRECPTGVLTREQLGAIYEQFFPFGDSTQFSNLVFHLYDSNGDGLIDFGEYMMAMSVTTRGRIEEKIQWAFRFYDQDGDGHISRTDMLTVVEAIYRMMGTMVVLAEDEDTPAKRVEKIFLLLSKEGSQSLSLDEFRAGAHADPSIVQALLMYDGIV